MQVEQIGSLGHTMVLEKSEAAREDESIDQAMCLIDNREAQILVAAWPRIPLKWMTRLRPKRRGMSDLDWAWDHTRVAADLLEAATGIPADQAAKIFVMCKVNRVIYPDGGVNKFAKALLNTIVERRVFARNIKEDGQEDS